MDALSPFYIPNILLLLTGTHDFQSCALDQLSHLSKDDKSAHWCLTCEHHYIISSFQILSILFRAFFYFSSAELV